MLPMKAFLPLALTAGVLAAALPGTAAPQPTGLDWNAGKIVVVGEGVPPAAGSPAKRRLMAKRAAMLDGYRKLAEIVHGVQVTGETSVHELEVTSDEVHTSVNGLLKNVQIADENVTDDGAYEIRLEMPLYGENSLASAVFTGHVGHHAATPAARSPQPAATDEPPPEAAMFSSHQESASGAPYSGVIVDARQLGVKAAMMPTLFEENGRELYVGNLSIPNEDLVAQGPVSYARSLDEARAHPRIGSTPLIVRAKRYRGPFHADLILADDEGNKLLAANEGAGFLKKLAVVIVK